MNTAFSLTQPGLLRHASPCIATRNKKANAELAEGAVLCISPSMAPRCPLATKPETWFDGSACHRSQAAQKAAGRDSETTVGSLSHRSSQVRQLETIEPTQSWANRKVPRRSRYFNNPTEELRCRSECNELNVCSSSAEF